MGMYGKMGGIDILACSVHVARLCSWTSVKDWKEAGDRGTERVQTGGGGEHKACSNRRRRKDGKAGDTASHQIAGLTLREALGMRLLGFWKSPAARVCCPVP